MAWLHDWYTHLTDAQGRTLPPESVVPMPRLPRGSTAAATPAQHRPEDHGP
jgi:hypothetical protein